MSALHEIALKFIKGIGNVTIKSLVGYCGGAREVFESDREKLLKVPGIGKKTAESIINHEAFERAEQELAFTKKYKIQPLSFTSANFPKRLNNCTDGPSLLYYKGNASLNNTKVIAVVGTRNATNYGKALCDDLIKGLQQHNILVVSGLAYGIDIAAHKAALNNNLATVGVLGHGLDRIYPNLHRDVAEKMVSDGGLLTEYPSLTPPERQHFPERNRIIAGMADAIIVVEATKRGGALITAEIANSYNRDVFAYPGRTNDELSEGCNYLIKTNRANLVTRTEDIEYILNWLEVLTPGAPKQPQITIFQDLNKEEKQIVELFQQQPQMAIDELSLSINMQQSKLAIHLLTLEMKNILVSLPGKVYRLA